MLMLCRAKRRLSICTLLPSCVVLIAICNEFFHHIPPFSLPHLQKELHSLQSGKSVLHSIVECLPGCVRRPNLQHWQHRIFVQRNSNRILHCSNTGIEFRRLIQHFSTVYRQHRCSFVTPSRVKWPSAHSICKCLS